MAPAAPLHLQYGVNAFADKIYEAYQPLKNTAHYPDPNCSDLRRALAQYTGLNEDMILPSSGSDELIDVYIRLQKARIPNLKVAYSPPTYPQYDAYTAREQVDRILLPHERATITAKLIKETGGDPATTVIMLDSPANPSGEIVTQKQFLGMLDAGFQVFADEAYYEFYGKTMAGYIDTYPDQLVVSRSFSKFAAMAGSRVGYLLASPKTIVEFRKWQLFFNVHSESQHRALYALGHINELRAAIKKMHETKEKMSGSIQALGAYEVLPSLSMYSIFKHHDIPTDQLHRMLQNDHGIFTTRFPHFKGHDIIRSAVLPMPQMKRFISALASYA